ncbi:hypothetical protein M885DRAFT_615698 [Pelagophyceae sp. CCMP2097]|nr:hypothetical protein M885DRAFT_615698 [Pelagophyceae sp. CCMP2097]
MVAPNRRMAMMRRRSLPWAGMPSLMRKFVVNRWRSARKTLRDAVGLAEDEAPARDDDDDDEVEMDDDDDDDDDGDDDDDDAPSPAPPAPTAKRRAGALCDDFDVCADFKPDKRPRIVSEPRAAVASSPLGGGDAAAELAKRQARAAKFAAAAAQPAPAAPVRTMAWSGGKVTSNRADATAKYLERDDLSEAQRAAAMTALKRAAPAA